MKRCACWYTVSNFLTLEKKTWLKTMQKAIKQLHPDGEQGNFSVAWGDCFDVLQQTLRNLSSADKLKIIFEYCLPAHRPGSRKAQNECPIRADVILLSRDTVTVLEFKRKSEVFIGDVRQTRKYRNRIQDFHDASRGMNKKAILVMTCAETFTKQYRKVVACSADQLAENLHEIYGDNTDSHSQAQKWIDSSFTVREGKKEEQNATET